MQTNNTVARTYRIPLLILCATGLLAAGCAGIRQVTYPVNFVYLEQAEVSSLMHSLASSMSELEKLVEMDDTAPGKTENILAQLEAIETETAILAATPDSVATGNEENGDFKVLRTNHLLLDEHIDGFRAEVAKAKWQIMDDPPNYYVIGQLTGGCNACHLQR